ncbi:MAG: DnaA regulatory inactivator Hda [Ectothiorhodospiraceae bacterium]|nr:DnaA regulatory inactivator Hda [Ectothiorhodospiraceae bacterium]
MVTEQIPLHFSWRDGLSFENYFFEADVENDAGKIVVSNAEAVHHIQQAAMGDAGAEQFLFLWGGTSVGKSHLLQAACQQAAAHQNTVAYLPMSELRELSGEIFDGLEQMSLVCIDDVHLITGDHPWEESLFHFYNRMRDAGGHMLVAADTAPAALKTQLADLQSRLSWGPVMQLRELDDAGKMAALQLRAHGRGFDLPNDVAQFLIRRSARDMASLFLLLDRLDEASLVHQRKLTIPFVRDLV